VIFQNSVTFYDSVSAHASKVIWHTGYGSGDCRKLDIALPYLTKPPILMLSIFKSAFESPSTLVYLSCNHAVPDRNSSMPAIAFKLF